MQLTGVSDWKAKEKVRQPFIDPCSFLRNTKEAASLKLYASLTSALFFMAYSISLSTLLREIFSVGRSRMVSEIYRNYWRKSPCYKSTNFLIPFKV